MENKTIVSVEELLAFNEMMLGRGMPIEEDGVGYNKADFGACSNYFYGLSDSQVADLAKRLVKYSVTQLNMDKQVMKDTAEYYDSLVKGDYDRTDGISLQITENGTLISFKYNESFIEVIKAQPKRQFDGESKQWIVPNDKVIPLLNELWTVGADCTNAMEYAMNHPLMEEIVNPKKVEILTKDEGDYKLIKFNYNQDIVNAIKETVDKEDREWNSKFKFWAIKQDSFNKLKEVIGSLANFKAI
jgi:hypothetical protein